MKNRTIVFFLIMLPGLLFAGCGGRIATPEGQACSEQLHIANQELDDAKLKGLSGTVPWLKAAGLLTAANTALQVEHFGDCLDKVRRARAYIREAQR